MEWEALPQNLMSDGAPLTVDETLGEKGVGKGVRVEQIRHG